MFVQFNFGPLIIEWLIQFSVWKKAELCINTLFVGFVNLGARLTCFKLCRGATNLALRILMLLGNSDRVRYSGTRY